MVTFTSTDADRAILGFAGEIGTAELRQLEELPGDSRLHAARAWVWDMREVTRLDLACAYALLRAATGRPSSTTLTIRGARHRVRRVLRECGLEAVAVVEE
ncbi:hypothetical protein LK08_30465 [Streptomyces sp. MUSC 125]|nr:hypothetical protein LK08_30465 [Streptomyces sp. MUSC 125]